MRLGGYAAGVLFLGVSAGAVTYGAHRVCRWRLSELSGVPLALAGTLLGACGLSLAVLLPGALGILTRGTFLSTAVVIGVVMRLLVPAPRGERARGGAARAGAGARLPGFSDLRHSLSAGWLLAGAAVIVVSAWLVGELIHSATHPLTSVDFVSYDLPIIGRWIQTGSVWHMTELFPLQTHGTYPQNSHLVLAAFVLPFHNDAFVRLPSYLALPITGLAVYAAAYELGASRSTAALAGALLCAAPAVAWDVEVAPPDAIGLAAYSIGVLFVLRHVRTRTKSDLVLAGLGMGFAAGAKWYFLSSVAAIAIIWVVASVVRARRYGPVWRRALGADALVFVGVIALSCGFWLVRNLLDAGDPFYPVRVVLGGQTIFNAPPDTYRHIAGFTVAQYLTNGSVLHHYIYPALRSAFGLPGLGAVLAIVTVIGRALYARARRAPQQSILLILAFTSIVLAVIYALTPYSAFGSRNQPLLAWANARYLSPAFALAVLSTAALPLAPRIRRGAECAAVIAVVFGIRGAYDHVSTGLGSLALGVLVVLVAAGLLLVARPLASRTRVPRLVLPGVATGAALILLAGGYGVQRRLNQSRYSAFGPTFAWIQAHPQPFKIGLAGSWNFGGLSPAWPMFGERIQNEVTFVGRLHGDRLVQYSDFQRWMQALIDGHYDLLEIAIGRPFFPTSDIEVQWAAQARLPVVSRGSGFELVQLPRFQAPRRS